MRRRRIKIIPGEEPKNHHKMYCTNYDEKLNFIFFLDHVCTLKNPCFLLSMQSIESQFSRKVLTQVSSLFSLHLFKSSIFQLIHQICDLYDLLQPPQEVIKIFFSFSFSLEFFFGNFHCLYMIGHNFSHA